MSELLWRCKNERRTESVVLLCQLNCDLRQIIGLGWHHGEEVESLTCCPATGWQPVSLRVPVALPPRDGQRDLTRTFRYGSGARGFRSAYSIPRNPAAHDRADLDSAWGYRMSKSLFKAMRVGSRFSGRKGSDRATILHRQSLVCGARSVLGCLECRCSPWLQQCLEVCAVAGEETVEAARVSIGLFGSNGEDAS